MPIRKAILVLGLVILLVAGGLSTGFTHAGVAYQIDSQTPNDAVVGVTAWEQQSQTPIPLF